METFNFGRQIAYVARLWRTELDRRLQPCDLSMARYVLLLNLVEAKIPLAQSDLADRLSITGPTVVRQLDLLEAAGLVQRQDAPSDRRIKLVALTDAGKAAYAEAAKIAAELRKELIAPLDDDTVTKVRGALRNIASRLESVRGREIADG